MYSISQNDKIVDVGRDLWRSSCQTPLPKQGHSQLLRTMSTRLLNISKDKDSTTPLGNLCQCLVILTVKKCFLMFTRNLLGFSLCPWPLVLSLNTTEKSLALSSQVFINITKISPHPSLLWSIQSQLSQLFFMGEVLQALNHLCGPSLDSLHYVLVPLVLGIPELDLGALSIRASSQPLFSAIVEAAVSKCI